MAIQQKQVDYAKEIDDVMVAVVKLISDVKAKKSAGEIFTDSLPSFMEAVTGLGQLAPEEANRKVFLETIGYRIGDFADALLP